MKDEFKIIRIGNIIVARGWECNYCGLLRGEDQLICNCDKAQSEIKRAA